MTFELVDGDTKRELAVSFSQTKEGFDSPQPLDEQPLSVAMRVKVNGAWIERAMQWDDANQEWFYRPQASDYAAIPPAANFYEMIFRLTWADGYQATAPTSGRDYLKVRSAS
jgi:hypothetical protein